MEIDLTPFYLTLKLSFFTTLILLVIGVPLAYWLSFSRNSYKYVFETLFNLPLVLPPSILGFYLLLLFSPSGFLGEFLEYYFDLRLVFSFSGILIGSVIFSLPFMLQALQAGFSSLPPSFFEVAQVLGKSRWETLFKVVLPNCKPAILGGMILSFAHTIGEFGVVLLIGGSIPNKTKLASIAIYEEVEAMNYGNAHLLSILLVATSTLVLLPLFKYRRRVNFLGSQKA
ncbi:molybdate ABC transporter permease subunit [Leptospira wolffii]|uniref:molybdate ABC transporter permease subunit n=1 Tax=Leptospira wolffii TaxID=409998 RepID=UPI001083E507|nr:molybdate ABC transporter permease subunit [Leptospira wolffii]TGK54814.1 molybdate ABC transporter permease subunit [Leptospira wolffii]TGK65347.1 molybdate ABC transporter permease subunit [Leptospira wolffii]TGK70736.1 molybdate ABC transporter permease subunit [Leptospira wolffii]TGL26455.1 molybdate ABC transporter permease subunit [Leptospira wolffii]